MLVILIGSKQAGKDTFARELTKNLDFTRVAFGDEVKKEILIGLEKYDHIIQYELVNHLTKPELKEVILPLLGVSARYLMQNWGADRREIDEFYWISRTLAKCNYLLEQDNNARIVITDCRYKNELDSILYWYSTMKPDHVYTVKIERDGLENDMHESESLAKDTSIKYDYTITNNGTEKEFQKKALEFGKYITREKDERKDLESSVVSTDTDSSGG